MSVNTREYGAAHEFKNEYFRRGPLNYTPTTLTAPRSVYLISTGEG